MKQNPLKCEVLTQSVVFANVVNLASVKIVKHFKTGWQINNI